MVEELIKEKTTLEKYDLWIKEILRSKRGLGVPLSYEEIAKMYAKEPKENYGAGDRYIRKTTLYVDEESLRLWLLNYNIPQNNELIKNVLPIAKVLCPYETY